MELHYRLLNPSSDLDADNKPTLIMMHGLFGSLENLSGIGRLLTEKFRVLSLDMRNHGRSPHSDQMNLGALAADINAFFTQHNIESAHLLGHSLGGKAMMEFALTHSNKAESLVVADIAPVGYDVRRHDAIFDALRAVDLQSVTGRSDVDKQVKEAIPELAVRSFVLKNLAKHEQGHYIWRANIDALYQQYDHLIAANRDSVFDGKVLFIKGGASDYIQQAHQEAVLQRFPNAQLKIMSDAGHWLHAENPELFTNLVKRFIG